VNEKQQEQKAISAPMFFIAKVNALLQLKINMGLLSLFTNKI
jgi:hypothetical protein